MAVCIYLHLCLFELQFASENSYQRLGRHFGIFCSFRGHTTRRPLTGGFRTASFRSSYGWRGRRRGGSSDRIVVLHKQTRKQGLDVLTAVHIRCLSRRWGFISDRWWWRHSPKTSRRWRRPPCHSGRSNGTRSTAPGVQWTRMAACQRLSSSSTEE